MSEVAWAAGFFDGEGWVGHVYSTKLSEGIRATIAQKDREVLDRFAQAVKCGVVAGPYKQKSPCFYWRITSEKNVKNVFSLLKPYLSSIKRKQFEEAITKYDNRPSKRRRLLKSI